MVTEDRDFCDSHLLRDTPQRLLVVSTGNITNADLLAVFEMNPNEVETALTEARFIELASDRLIVHRSD